MIPTQTLFNYVIAVVVSIELILVGRLEYKKWWFKKNGTNLLVSRVDWSHFNYDRFIMDKFLFNSYFFAGTLFLFCIFTVLLDYSTSFVMMSLHGPSVESNVYFSTLFAKPTFSNFVLWFSSDGVFDIVILSTVFLGYFFLFHMRKLTVTIRLYVFVGFTIYPVILFSEWFSVGPVSNLFEIFFPLQVWPLNVSIVFNVVSLSCFLLIQAYFVVLFFRPTVLDALKAVP